ncbi:MAG: paraquat-inducible protein A [Methylobacter sp.]|jgi:paraquat-inducible protein A|uniref:paraquat-inducible protein A n=1 Tax=Methylobacter sp. TaxID=2051955 RepID=UPI0025FFD1FB|nr:paraquat-inducible protein A [Methylobacter sp.]MCK9620473.1 paraquat-inducible protein A [Methylobacter sp.]
MISKKTALGQGFIRCHDCGCLSIKSEKNRLCPLCGGRLHPRLPNSFQRTVALLLSAFCLYIPANIFPIMTVTRLGVGEPHTIIGGIIALIHGNMVPIAMLVLVASILVPLLKLVGLGLLLLNVHYRWQAHAKKWTIMYRIIAFVGRWSMLDIFMISILVSLVDMGGVAQVIAGPAATAFAAVVVLTMFAAKSFDPRLIWDNQY